MVLSIRRLASSPTQLARAAGFLSVRKGAVRAEGLTFDVQSDARSDGRIVLDGTYMPSVLVEAGFISHSVEGKRLTSNTYRDAVAEGLYRGIKQYFEDDRTAQLR